MRDRGIYGLVLAGGKSERMGMPKAELIYYDRPQWAYCANLLAPYCDRIFISLESDDQIEDVPEEMRLVDEHPGGGPLSGILTAVQKYPDNTWLVIASDMPGIDRAIMHRLVRFRDPDSLVSCFSDEDGNVEPLLSFWEAGIHTTLSDYARRQSSAIDFIRKNKSMITPLEAKHFIKLKSINTPEERKEFLKTHSSGNDRYQEL